jgi:hypothetical protein
MPLYTAMEPETFPTNCPLQTNDLKGKDVRVASKGKTMVQGVRPKNW